MSPSSRPSSPHPKASAFRFKSKRSRSPSPSTSPAGTTTNSHRPSFHRHRHHHRRHHRSHRPAASPSPPPSPPRLDPDTAFRESLFDALADDEGAAFWEGVYGQPIHTYSPYRFPADAPGNGEGEGELERMTDEEYTAHVRAKMWEKSHGYIREERAKREDDRAKRKEWEREEGRRQGEREVWGRRVDEVLGRKRVVRHGAEWKAVWQRYVNGWDVLGKRVAMEAREPGAGAGDADASVTPGGQKAPRWKESMIPWPIKSGKLSDIDTKKVEEFLRKASRLEIGTEDDGADHESKLLKVLKAERVRWHPDKIQQRYGGLGIDDDTMKGVTAVFQIVDQMWVAYKEALG